MLGGGTRELHFLAEGTKGIKGCSAWYDRCLFWCTEFWGGRSGNVAPYQVFRAILGRRGDVVR